MNLFDHLNALTQQDKELNKKDDSEIKSYQPYMINRFISMSEMYIPFVNEINKFPDIPKDVHYSFFNSLLPKRRQFFKYIKKKKDLRLEEKQYIATYFECGIREAEQHIKILTKDQINEILSKFRYGRNEKIDV